MKEYFNSFDDIKFFHTFSSISRDMKIVTLNEIHRYIQNFMFYKIFFSLLTLSTAFLQKASWPGKKLHLPK